MTNDMQSEIDDLRAALATARASERERVCIELHPEKWPNEADRNIAYKCVETIRNLKDAP